MDQRKLIRPSKPMALVIALTMGAAALSGAVFSGLGNYGLAAAAFAVADILWVVGYIRVRCPSCSTSPFTTFITYFFVMYLGGSSVSAPPLPGQCPKCHKKLF